MRWTLLFVLLGFGCGTIPSPPDNTGLEAGLSEVLVTRCDFDRIVVEARLVVRNPTSQRLTLVSIDAGLRDATDLLLNRPDPLDGTLAPGQSAAFPLRLELHTQKVALASPHDQADRSLIVQASIQARADDAPAPVWSRAEAEVQVSVVRRPEFVLVEIRHDDIRPRSARLTARFVVSNANAFGLTLSRQTLDFSVAGIAFPAVDSRPNLWLAPESSTAHESTLELDLTGAQAPAYAELSEATRRSAAVTVEARFAHAGSRSPMVTRVRLQPE